MNSSSEHQDIPLTNRYKDRIAHIVWAAQILSYLTKKESQPPLHDTNNEPDYDSNSDTDESIDSESDCHTERAEVLSGPRDSVGRKFLDCIAQLLSPCKGWDGVTAAGMRGGEHGVVVHVASNDGFRPHLAGISGSEQGMVARASPPTVFEIVSINYASRRVDDWISGFQNMMANCGNDRAWRLQAEPGYEAAAAAWTEMLHLLAGFDHQERAYKCVRAPLLRGWLVDAFGAKNGVKLWGQLNFIARPILDCRLLREITIREPQFQRAEILLLPTPSKTVLDSEYVLDIFEAWEQLGLGTAPEPVFIILQLRRDHFREACAEPFSLHAEMQLVSHYEDPHSARPTLDYFGCSKKTCLLCESFLGALPIPITTRGRHGIFYPAWGIPTEGPVSIEVASEGALKDLVTRIQSCVRALIQGKRNVTIPPVKQSDMVSDFSQLTLQEEGRVPDSQPQSRPQEDFEPDDCCVMCNKTPALPCTTCGSTYYCSDHCRTGDMPSHSLLCREFATQPPRPSQSHRRAIFFPVDDEKPRMIWILCVRQYDEDDGVPWMEVRVDPYLGNDNPTRGTLRVEHNPVRNRNLGSGIAAFYPRKQGYCVSLIHRDTYLLDGSATNQSIQASVIASCSATTPHFYRGPMVAICELPDEEYADITLEDFRHLMEYLRSYRDTHVRESIPGVQHHSSTTARGVKVCCVDVTIANQKSLGPKYISPISAILGVPLILWKDPNCQFLDDQPGYEGFSAPWVNQNVTFLCMETDLKSPEWGWAPPYWRSDVGNVIAVREDGEDLTVMDVEMMCHFARHKLQPMFEDALESGGSLGGKRTVLDFITWRNMLAHWRTSAI
ncbi:hypothetical protein BJX68DRAFT_256734 [Aspergillus pseudodeflectus]|uniref:MYND-type domain-containing protein n=1 Tax=Aspergillus pseudodeflectus TaxID=176178 RepID=A0ABR4JZN7_9EURO